PVTSSSFVEGLFTPIATTGDRSVILLSMSPISILVSSIPNAHKCSNQRHNQIQWHGLIPIRIHPSRYNQDSLTKCSRYSIRRPETSHVCNRHCIGSFLVCWP